MSCLRLFCLCCEWLVYVVILAGVSRGTKKNLELVVWGIYLHLQRFCLNFLHFEGMVMEC